jgi:flagellar hook assembly protein FlgD
MPLAGPVTLTVYNITGQQVRVLMSGDAAAGVHTVVWDARDDSGSPVPSGIYLYRLITAGGVEVQKMQLVR